MDVSDDEAPVETSATTATAPLLVGPQPEASAPVGDWYVERAKKYASSFKIVTWLRDFAAYRYG